MQWTFGFHIRIIDEHCQLFVGRLNIAPRLFLRFRKLVPQLGHLFG